MPDQAEAPDLGPDSLLLHLTRQLHAGRYTPAAWRQFCRGTWQPAQATAIAAPRLFRSWARLAAGGTAVIAAAGLGAAMVWSRPVMFLFLASSLAWWAILMMALFLHLGLMVEPETGRMLDAVGLPNALTVARAFSVIWVLWAIAHSAGGNFVPLAVIFGAAMLTDAADGYLARRSHRVTRWGRLYDPIVDGILFGPAALGLALRGIFPGWLGALVILRYAFPIAGAAVFLLVRRRTLKVRHTPWGQLSTASIAGGVFLAALFGAFGAQEAWSIVAPGIHAAVAVAMVLAMLTILKRGLEQA